MFEGILLLMFSSLITIGLSNLHICYIFSFDKLQKILMLYTNDITCFENKLNDLNLLFFLSIVLSVIFMSSGTEFTALTLIIYRAGYITDNGYIISYFHNFK